MKSKYKLLPIEEVSHMFFSLGYQFDRMLTFNFNTRKSATTRQLDNILDWWVVQLVQVVDSAIIIAMDYDGNYLEYKKIPWSSKCVEDFLDDYCKRHSEKYNGIVRVMYQEWLKTDWDYYMEKFEE